MKGLFVTGTDTNVGKTVVSSWLARHWQADYWKPIQSGIDTEHPNQATDSMTVAQLTGTWCHPEIYRFKEAVSPHLAAELNASQITLDAFKRPDAERLVVEGAGGVLVPLNREHTIADLIAYLQLPVLLVARSSLGTINHTCLSLEALRARNIPIVGVIMNGEANQSNRDAISYYGKIEVLAEFPQLSHVCAETLQQTPLPLSLHHRLLQLEHGRVNFE